MSRALWAAGALLQLALPAAALTQRGRARSGLTAAAVAHSPKESAAMRKEAFEKEFTVELNLAKAREAGTPLGLKVDIESEFAPPSLKVISDDIVREWSEANPDREVLVGDHIAGVDGQAWHHNARSLGERMKSMFQAVKKSAPGAAEFLNMNIRRPRATELPQLQDLHSRLCARSFRAQLVIPVSRVERTLADALGWQLNVSGGYWMPAIIGEVKRGGLVAKWNEDNPENSLLPGDEIMGVNGVTWQHNSYAFIQKVVKEFKAPRSNKLEQKGALTLALSARRPALRPGRTQPLREGDQHAQVEKARWERRCGGLELDPVLGSGAVVLMDAEWMVRRARTGGVLEPRQALPPTAFVPHSAVKAASQSLLHIACISHCWLQANHPDPRGHNLRIVGQALQLLLGVIGGRWGVFMDFCCIHQNCRDREGVPQQHTYQRLEGSDSFEDDALGRFELEHALFKEALGSLGSFYSHPATVVFMLTRFPDDYGDAAKYTRSGNTEQYFNRGWCFCESSWGMLTKPASRLLDLGRCTGAETDYGELLQTCRAGRRAPLLPDAFDVELQSKGFTNGKDDRPRVAELYRSAFAQRFEAAEELLYAGLQWGDEEAQQLAAVLASGAAPRLRRLHLAYNRVGDEGAARLAEALRAPGALPRLRELSLYDNRVGDEGAARLAEALRAPGALPQLRLLDLRRNPLGVGGPGRAALRAAWAEAGRPECGLWLGD